MKIFFKEILVELRNITTIDLACKTSNLLEKILWSLIGIIGTIWAAYFVTLQVISWNQSPSVLIQGNVETTDLKYPAVTLCPKVTTRWGIVERLGNYIDPLNLPKELLLLRHNSFMCATGFLKKISQYDTSKEAFKSDCIPKYSIGESSDSCKYAESLYKNAKSRNFSIEKIYEELSSNILKQFTGDSSVWNMSEPALLILKKFMVDEIERVKLNNQTDEAPLNVESIDESDFKFIYRFYEMFDHFLFEEASSILFKKGIFTKNMDWSTRAVGSFFMKNLQNFKDEWEGSENFTAQLHGLFTLPKQHLSLPYIASLYSVNDFRALAIDEVYDIEFSELMKPCIQEVESNTFGNHTTELFFKEEVNPWNYIEPSPCLDNTTRYESCNNYCKWHNTYFKELNKNDFITLMKFSTPQRKLSLSSTQAEEELAERIFGNSFTEKLKHTSAPFSLILFCYQKNNGFMGDDIGIFAKVCNEFFPTPTDQGICLTQNMDIKEVMKTNKEYEPLFEPNQQKSPKSVKDGTYLSKQTLAFYSGTGMDNLGLPINSIEQIDTRDMKNKGEVRLKFHQANQIPDLLEDNRLQNYFSTSSLILKSGYEYEIKVMPKVFETTPAFKKMNLEQRKCKLSHEVEENSIFKVYTQQNCKYECYVKKAESLCKCIPWDFMHQNAMAKECDIFGRTCFYNAMKNISLSINFCNDCVKECDYITYDGIVIKETSRKLLKIRHTYFDHSKICEGEKFLCDYFWPDNTTNIIDKGLENLYNSMKEGNDFKERHSDMAKDLVIVHWLMLEPEINVIDAKYSIDDKIANFGGNFGIFAEITGCSFLGMLNFLILLFKLIFSVHSQNHECIT